jgi:hypothetical protein
MNILMPVFSRLIRKSLIAYSYKKQTAKKGAFIITEIELHASAKSCSSHLSEDFDNRTDRIPIACGDRHAHPFLDLAQTANCAHLAAVQAERKSIFDCDQF